jgi:DNA invertase Pin-like site-specific DNA recombinase
MSKPLAYSYVRFSSEKQSQGDSLARQLTLAEKYAKEHGLTLDTHSYRDLGVSAFKGKNAVEGKLGTFIKAVEAGIVKAGSYLLVESLDRLSRAEVTKALTLFMSLIDKGITIVTLADNCAVYSAEKMKDDSGMSLIMSILVMIRANEESATKSKRVKAAWAAKAEKGDILTKVCPAWMKHDGEKFVLIPERVDVVKRMFDLYTHGHGSPYIAKKLNDEGIKPFGWADFWTNGTIASILTNPAAYGTLRRKKADAPSIPKYYPAAVTESKFLDANAAGKARQWKGGTRGAVVANLFSGMCYCGKCGSKMRVTSTRAGSTYLKCLKAFNTEGCDAKSVSVPRVEASVLDRLWNGQMRQIILDRSEIVVDPTATLKTEVKENEAKLNNLIKLAELTNDVESIAVKINSLQLATDKLRSKIKNTPVDHAVTNEEFNETKRTMDQLAKSDLPSEVRAELRTKLQAGIRRIIKKVELFGSTEVVKVTFASGNVRSLEFQPIERYRVNGTFATRTE